MTISEIEIGSFKERQKAIEELRSRSGYRNL